jgi:hypothetical protein
MTLIERLLDRKLDLVALAGAQRAGNRSPAAACGNGHDVKKSSWEHLRIE